MTEVLRLVTKKEAHTPDDALEDAKGWFTDVLIVGFDHDGDVSTFCSAELPRAQALWLIEAFKTKLLAGEV